MLAQTAKDCWSKMVEYSKCNVAYYSRCLFRDELCSITDTSEPTLCHKGKNG